MVLKQRLFSKMFFRNMKADLFGRSAYSKEPGSFTPFFQYKIAPNNPRDYHLYFPCEPYAQQYYNEIFNKLFTFKAFDIVGYLEFHYEAYLKKNVFLRFIQYEVNDRLKQSHKNGNRYKLESAKEWITEKQQGLQNSQQAELRKEIETGVREFFPVGQTMNELETDSAIEKLSGRMEKILANAEEQLTNITGAFMTGKIVLNNQNHEQQLIQVLKLLQTVQACPQKGRMELLFKKFADIDIAAILRFHFEAFQNQKLNTVQTKVSSANERLRINNPKVQKLTVALQEFFYQ